MMSHPIKFGQKRVISSADNAEAVIHGYLSTYCGFDLEDSKPIFLQDTLANDDASQYHV